MIGAVAILLCTAPIAIDGDTVKCPQEKTSVRLFGIQAPELGEPGSEESKQSLQRLVDGGLVCELTGQSYNRRVGECFNTRMFNVGLFQIWEKQAVEWCSYSHNLYRTCE